MRIAIIEDNKPLADGIASAFEADGHGVDCLYDGINAAAFLAREQVDLIIMDINLPGRSGLDVLQGLRKGGAQTPVLLLSARDELSDKITGLDLGADDYLTKPFDLDELKARARAMLRRGEKQIANEIVLGDLRLDQEARALYNGGTELTMPRREYALAEALMKNSHRILSKAQLLDHLYGSSADADETTVELYIHRLRKRIANSRTEIKTVRGLGYCLREKT